MLTVRVWIKSAEAARDKFPLFLRKTLWKFVALFATLLHFLQKRHFCRFLFYQLQMTSSPLFFLRFVPTDGIGKLESGGAEVFEQLPNAGMVVDGQHDFSFAFHH